MDMEKQSDILANIIAIRRMKGLRQVDIAKHLGISRGAYSLIEGGQRGLQYETLLAVAEALGVSVVDIILYSAEHPSTADVYKDKYYDILEKYTSLLESLRNVPHVNTRGKKGDTLADGTFGN